MAKHEIVQVQDWYHAVADPTGAKVFYGTSVECAAWMAEHLNQKPSIDTRLRIALGRLEQFLGPEPGSRQLVRSVTVAIEAVAGTVTLPRHHVVQTIRTLVGEIEQTNLPLDQVEEARVAYGDLCEAWGFMLVDGRPSAAPVSRPVHAAALAGHLATLIELHHDDERDTQHADPILEAYHPPELSSLRLKTESGRQFMVSVIELPA